MKNFQKSDSVLKPFRCASIVLITLTAGFTTPTLAANDFEGGRLGVERQKVERPQGGQADRRPGRQEPRLGVENPRERRTARPPERHADRQHDRHMDRHDRYEEHRRIDRHRDHRVYRPPVWRGDIRYFDRHDLPRWRGGAWRHARHQGRLGWWWVVGGSWYFYSQPVYPYPDPYIPPVVITQSDPVEPAPAIIVAPAAASQSWYFCVSSDSYYPYVASCPEGWTTVPATPPDKPVQ